jgi:conjugal transfer ATP-binding protein TraC
MAVPTLAELIQENYTGDVEWLETDLLTNPPPKQPEPSAPIESPAPPQESFTQSTANDAPIVPPPARIPLDTDTSDSLFITPELARPNAPETLKEKTVSVVEDPNKKLTKEEADELRATEKEYKEALAFVKDMIAPPMMRIDATKLQIGDTFVRTIYTYAYPDVLEGNWLSPLINWDVKFDVSMFIYPVDSAHVMRFLRRRLTQLRSQYAINRDKGLIEDPHLNAQMQDVEELQISLTRGQEKYFHFSLYITTYAETEDDMKRLSNTLDVMLSGRNILTKQALLRTEQGFVSTGPFARDEVLVYRNISTKGLSTTFPFSSNSLSQDDGIFYGINTHNNSLIIFDRFRTENANMCVFAKSGWGKSFAVKLEILRSLMMGTDVIVLDPENEYKALVDTVGGTYLNINLNSNERINPFDLPRGMKDTEAHPGDLLRGAIVNMIWLLRLMLGVVTPSEEAIMERALITTYSLKGITMEDDRTDGKEIPLMKDFVSVLETMDGAKGLVERLDKYVNGVFAWVFSQSTNVDLKDGLVVFSVRDLDEILRPIAMYIILNYVWNVARSSERKRTLVVDEAWNIMQYEDSAKFLFGLVKRARKYGLGVTTITQDVEDFMQNQYGKAIVTNSSIQLLLKQSPASIDILQDVFKLTEQEKYILLNASVGTWLFFAGWEHVGIQILASYFEEKIITTKPKV